MNRIWFSPILMILSSLSFLIGVFTPAIGRMNWNIETTNYVARQGCFYSCPYEDGGCDFISESDIDATCDSNNQAYCDEYRAIRAFAVISVILSIGTTFISFYAASKRSSSISFKHSTLLSLITSSSGVILIALCIDWVLNRQEFNWEIDYSTGLFIIGCVVSLFATIASHYGDRKQNQPEYRQEEGIPSQTNEGQPIYRPPQPVLETYGMDTAPSNTI